MNSFFLFFFFAGPDLWGSVSEQCNGRAQSPVNIVTRRVLPDGRLTHFQLTGYQDIFHSQLINNGHTGMPLFYYFIYLFFHLFY